MSNRNYTQYSKMSGEESTLISKPEVNSNIHETELVSDACGLDGCCFAENESVIIEPAVMITPTEQEPSVEPAILKIGEVFGCKRLNIRAMPSVSAEIVSEINEGTEVMIDDADSNALFYKVCTEHGIEGYCMKRFIAIKP